MPHIVTIFILLLTMHLTTDTASPSKPGGGFFSPLEQKQHFSFPSFLPLPPALSLDTIGYLPPTHLPPLFDPGIPDGKLVIAPVQPLTLSRAPITLSSPPNNNLIIPPSSAPLVREKKTTQAQKKWACPWQQDAKDGTKCTYRGASRKQLETHLLVHTKEKPFRCPKCPDAFAQLIHLRHHIAVYHIHPEIRPFYCPQCPFSTTRKEAVPTHIRSAHQEEKGILPQVDGKKWEKLDALVEELMPVKKKFTRRKRGEKSEIKFTNVNLEDSGSTPPVSLPPLLAPGIQYGELVTSLLQFFDKGSKTTLPPATNTIINNPSQERPYVCPQPGCAATFAQEANLKNHITECHIQDLNLKPFYCPQKGCDYKATRNWLVTRHIGSIHPSQKTELVTQVNVAEWQMLNLISKIGKKRKRTA